MKPSLYAPWPDGARVTPGWAAILLVLGFFALSNVPTLAAVIVFVVLAAQDSGDAAGASVQATRSIEGLLIPLLLVQFLLLAVLTLAWAGLYERRGLPSLGLGGRGAFGRYLAGLPVGVGLMLAVGAAAASLSVAFGDGPVAPEGGLGAPAAGAALAVLAGCSVFLVQGAIEELVFRGWLMSTLAARWGRLAAVIVSSLVFMILHAHVFASGLGFGLVALVGLGMTGLVFALLCVLTRSVWEAAAAHGAFNFTAMAVPTLAVLAEDPSRTARDAFAEAFARATGTAAAGLGPESFGQALAAGVIAAGLAVLIARQASGRRRSEAARDPQHDSRE